MAKLHGGHGDVFRHCPTPEVIRACSSSVRVRQITGYLDIDTHAHKPRSPLTESDLTVLILHHFHKGSKQTKILLYGLTAEAFLKREYFNIS